jgi:hypothetical protein
MSSLTGFFGRMICFSTDMSSLTGFFTGYGMFFYRHVGAVSKDFALFMGNACGVRFVQLTLAMRYSIADPTAQIASLSSQIANN